MQWIKPIGWPQAFFYIFRALQNPIIPCIVYQNSVFDNKIQGFPLNQNFGSLLTGLRLNGESVNLAKRIVSIESNPLRAQNIHNISDARIPQEKKKKNHSANANTKLNGPIHTE